MYIQSLCIRLYYTCKNLNHWPRSSKVVGFKRNKCSNGSILAIRKSTTSESHLAKTSRFLHIHRKNIFSTLYRFFTAWNFGYATEIQRWTGLLVWHKNLVLTFALCKGDPNFSWLYYNPSLFRCQMFFNINVTFFPSNYNIIFRYL